MMLNYLGEENAAIKIENALKSILKNKDFHTKDIVGNLTTTEFKNQVLYNINS